MQLLFLWSGEKANGLVQRQITPAVASPLNKLENAKQQEGPA